jgi:four helix bundle protein
MLLSFEFRVQSLWSFRVFRVIEFDSYISLTIFIIFVNAMATFKKIEEILVWKKSRELVHKIYSLFLNDKINRDFAFRDQIKRAVISIMTNIAEGYGRKSNIEFANFLNYSHGSVVEVESLLYIALDQHYIAEVDFKNLYTNCEEISKMIFNLQIYLRKSNQPNQ